ncbi:MAG: hypothetical protein RIR33_2618 [Pseudomonadota bacterium]|jgi:hypothetical protein
MKLAKVAAICLACLSSGCASTIFGSTPLRTAGLSQSAPELVYALPKAVIPISLSVVIKDATLVLDIGQPLYRPDDTHTFVLNHKVNVANSDTLKVSLDNEGLFLKSLKTNASGEYDAVLRGIAKSAVAIAESQPVASGEVRLLDLLIDPADLADTERLTADLTNARNAYVESSQAACRDAEGRQQKRDARANSGAQATPEARRKQESEQQAARLEALETCLEPLSALEKAPVPRLDLSPGVSRAGPVNSEACVPGVCYRPSVEQTLTVRWNGRVAQRAIRMPNGQPVRVIPLPRPTFADASVTDIEFVDGSPREITIGRPSEAKEAVLLPFNIVGDAISAVTSSVLTLETKEIEEERKRIDAEANLVKAETALLEAQEAAEKKRDSDGGPQAESNAGELPLISMTSTGKPRGGSGLDTPDAGGASGASTSSGAAPSQTPTPLQPGRAEDPNK